MQTTSGSDFIKIAVLDNSIEAQLISSILDQMNIPHRIRSYYDTAYDGLFQVQKGWGELRAPLAYQNEILDVLVEVRSNNFISNNDKL
jgi:hypothetical protein